MLEPGSEISIVGGEEPLDPYGRSLVYLRLQDGRDPAAELLREGLAQQIAVPPNLAGVDCYQDMERRARRRNLGLWRLSRYQAIPAEQMRDRERGFYRVSGRVRSVGRSRKSLWLNLSTSFVLRIARTNLALFGTLDPESWQGRRIEVRGWVTRQDDRQILRVRHPANIEVQLEPGDQR